MQLHLDYENAAEYRLGNRSALEWVLDQYQVTTNKRSGIVSDPNRPDAPEYIVRLVGRVVIVSLETVRLVGQLRPASLLPDGSPLPPAEEAGSCTDAS
jgi:predicted helicase